MERKGADHIDSLSYLKKIEGQIRGIQKMIGERRYCVDILTQLHSIVGAISSVEEKIFKTHLENCVASSLEGKSKKEKERKIGEIIELISRFRKP